MHKRSNTANCIQMNFALCQQEIFLKGKTTTAELGFYVAVSTWYNNMPHPLSIMKWSMVDHSRVGFTKLDELTFNHVFSKY